MAATDDVRTLEPSCPKLPFYGYQSPVELSNDGHFVLTNGRVWDTTSGAPVAPTFEGFEFQALSRDGRLVAAQHEARVVVWTVEEQPREVVQIEVPKPGLGVSYKLQFDGSGAALLVTSQSVSDDHKGIARLHDLKSGRKRFDIPSEGILCRSGFSSNGKLCFTSNNNQKERTVQLHNVDTGQPVGPPCVHSNRIDQVAIHDSGSYLVTADGQRGIRIWDGSNGGLNAGPFPVGGLVRNLALDPSPSIMRFISIREEQGSEDLLWSLTSAKVQKNPFKLIEGYRIVCNKFQCAAFDGIGRVVVAKWGSSGYSGTGKMGAYWWLLDGKTLRPEYPVVETDWNVRKMVFSSDSRKLAVACCYESSGNDPHGGSVHVYDVPVPRQTLSGSPS